MRMFRQISLLPVAFLSILLALAGCGGGGNNKDTPSGNPSGGGTTTKSFTVHFKKPDLWKSANIHYWGNATPTVWPGAAMTNDGNSWYSYKIPAPVTGIIFNGGDGGPQTANLQRDKDGWYDFDLNEWTDTNPVNIFRASVAPAGTSFSTDGVDVTFSLSNNAAEARYSLDGTNPKTGGILFSNGTKIHVGSGLAIGAVTTLRIYAKNGADIIEKTYTFTKTKNMAVVNPQFNNLRIYQVMVESFQDGDASANYGVGYGTSNHKGDLKGITNAIPYIASLGVNAIWLTPIFSSEGIGTMSNPRLDATGYFARDYFKIDSHFGTLADAKKLVDTAHANGLYVLFDGVFGHNKGNVVTSPKGNRPSGTANLATYPGSLEFYKEVATYWIDELGIDGWRLDQVYQLSEPYKVDTKYDMQYLREIRMAVENKAAERAKNGEKWGTLGYMVGEIWKDEASIGNQGYGSEASPGILSCFDFPMRYRLVQTLASEESGKKALDAITLDSGFATRSRYPDFALPNLMLTNHDLVRFGDLIQRAFPDVGVDSDEYWQRHKSAFSFMTAYTGPITIYYGDEIGAEIPGYAARVTTGCSDQGLCDDHVSRTNGKIANFNARETNLKDYVAQLMKLRKDHPALWSGVRQNLVATGTRYADLKSTAAEKIVYVLNTAKFPDTIALSRATIGGAKLRDAITQEAIAFSGNNYNVPMESLSGRFFTVE